MPHVLRHTVCQEHDRCQTAWIPWKGCMRAYRPPRMLTACCQHKRNQGCTSYLHNKDVIVRNLWLLFAKVPYVLIDMTMGRSKTGSKKHHMRVIGNSSSIVDLTAKPLSQPGPPNGPSPEGKTPGVSPLLHLRQRMQLMTMTIANDDASAPHQSHLPRVDTHLRRPLHTTSPLEQITSNETTTLKWSAAASATCSKYSDLALGPQRRKSRCNTEPCLASITQID